MNISFISPGLLLFTAISPNSESDGWESTAFFFMFPYFPMWKIDLSLLRKDSVLLSVKSVVKLPVASVVWFHDFFCEEGTRLSGAVCKADVQQSLPKL